MKDLPLLIHVLDSFCKGDCHTTGLFPICFHKVYCITIGSSHRLLLSLHSIDFQAVEDPLLNNGKVDDIQSKSGNNTTKKAIKKNLHSTLGKWFHFNKQEWSYLDKNEKKCVMLSARLACYTTKGHSTWRSLPESRFGEVLVITAGDKLELVKEIETRVLSASITYASYFFYKLSSDQSKFESPLERSDGWIEVKAWEFKTGSNPKTVSMNLKFKHPVKKDLSGLIIYGIELRPI
ncbi:kinase-like domain, phloem protein 2-like protein [Tanacetum coccineum]